MTYTEKAWIVVQESGGKVLFVSAFYKRESARSHVALLKEWAKENYCKIRIVRGTVAYDD